MQFDNFFCYKDIGSKAFFTMATLLMPLLGNVFFVFLGVLGNEILFLGDPRGSSGILGDPRGFEE